jgi:hypothetical protein
MSEQTPKKVKKLAKEIEGSVVKISVEGGTPMEFDFTTLPKDIRVKFGPFGLGHKLGDAAAGKSGAEAEEAINKVWEGLMSGDWTTRAPAAPSSRRSPSPKTSATSTKLSSRPPRISWPSSVSTSNSFREAVETPLQPPLNKLTILHFSFSFNPLTPRTGARAVEVAPT